jgi:hypothetical protein
MLPLERQQSDNALKLFQLGQLTFTPQSRRAAKSDAQEASEW